MSITEAIELLKSYNGPLGLTLHSGASDDMISRVETAYGIKLPIDIKTFYRFTDGFETVEDIFNMIPIAEIIDNKNRHSDEPFYIAEYMIYSDMWQLEINPDDCNDYKIIIAANYNKLVLTKSLAEFIARFLKGGVFDSGGLYYWQEEVELQPVYTTHLKTAQALLTVFYYGLRYDFISKKEVVDWADRIVVHENEPETFFVEISLSHDVNELISLLSSVHIPESSIVVRAILGLLYHRLSEGVISVDKAISVMDKLDSKLLTPFEIEHLYYFTDDVWMDTPVIDFEKLKRNLLDFLAYYKGFEITNFKKWLGFDLHIKYKLKEPEYSDPSNQKKQKRELQIIYATVYALALLSFIVVIVTYPKVEDKIHLNKFNGDLYQVSELYLFFFICYYVFESVIWLINKIVSCVQKLFK